MSGTMRKSCTTSTAGRQSPASAIGTMGERSLHAGLKRWYADPGDRFEVTVDGFQVDIVRGDMLIEIQTRGFRAIRRKLEALAGTHKVRLVHPIPQEKWIVRLAGDGFTVLSRRRSPRQGCVEDVFGELVSIPTLAANPNFSLEVLLTREEEVRRPGDSSQWRRARWRRHGWDVFDRRLIEVVQRVKLHRPADFRRFLPASLPQPFTTADLAEAGGHPRFLARKIAYCLREMGAIRVAGKKGNAVLYLAT